LLKNGYGLCSLSKNGQEIDEMLDLKNVEKTRNTKEHLNYYQEMNNVMENSGLSYQEIMWDFPVFASRQKITYFLERYELFKMVQNIPGDFIELGVAGGFGLMSFAHFCSIFEPTHYVRKIVGFDTFEGFPEIGDKDTSQAEHMKEGGLAHFSYEYLLKCIELYDQNRFLSHIEKVELVKGRVEDTLPKYIEENPQLTVGMLYLDVDLYSPTKTAIELLWDRIPKGGIVVFDELNHSDYPGETLALIDTLGIGSANLKRLPFASMAAYLVKE
jgi:hypothetical protein